MSAATELTNQIIDFIYRAGGYAWRSSSVGIYDQQKRAYRTAAKKGVSDILACFKGQLIAIEIKIGADRLSLEQQGFLENISAAGGNYFIASDFSGFTEWWNKQYP
jgi:Holliday junction resolvase